MAVEQAQAPGDRSAGFVEPPVELGACRPAVLCKLLRRGIASRPLVGANAQMKVRHAESYREIAVQHADIRRRVRRTDLPGRALDQRPEGDLVPMLLEQVAE